MEKVVDFSGQCSAHPAYPLQISQAGRRHGAGRAEMLQQRTLAPGAHACNLVQGIGADGGAALLAVAADGETMGLVAQPLQVIENRTFGIEPERITARNIEMLAS